MKLPAHKCGLALEHNEHRNYYLQAEQWIRENEAYEFASDEARQRAIETDEIWTLHWYPNTPISFYSIAAPTLEELLEQAAAISAGTSAY